MSDDVITGVVLAAVLLPSAAVVALYWRRRFRFTSGADPVLMCALRWRKWPGDLGWRQGILRLSEDQLCWRRRLTFRSEPDVVLRRSTLSLAGRTRQRWQAAIWFYGGDELTLATPDGVLGVTLRPDDADTFLEWLGTSADRPPARFSRRVSIALWFVFAGVTVVLAAYVYHVSWLFPVAAIAAVVAVGFAAELIAVIIRRRRMLPDVLRDEFVSGVREVFDFLPDFGFTEAYVRHLPWTTSLAFDGKGTRWIAITLDRRRERLELEMGRKSDLEAHRLRDLLAGAGHPDPDRVCRYTGDDGPLHAALEANAHALRLWARPFLTAET